MSVATQFSLSKWYLDCVTDEGDAFVGYSALLQWKSLSLEYSSILVRRTTGEIQTKATLQGGKHPDVSGGTVRWDCPSLKLSGTWRTLQPPIRHKIFAASNTPLDWICLQPHAMAEIEVKDLGTFKGFGYVDYLDLSAQPWKLPLDELRWGRFLSADESIIWLDFKGPSPETFVFRNGALCVGASVSDEGIIVNRDEVALTFDETKVLRDGALVSTALSVIPGIDHILPARMLNTHETKWRSRGILKRGDSTLNMGWTIHEVVRWPQSKSSQR